MTLKELLLQRISDVKPTCFQLLESLREIAQESPIVGAFKNPERSRER
jgi:hypothetical protein